jgi:hypothetical protein
MPYSLEDDLCSKDGLRYTFDYLLPVVQAGTTITYGEIAEKLAEDLHIDGKVFPVHVGHVVGTLMERILDIDNAAPLINVIVVRQGSDQPSSGADGFLRNRFHLGGTGPINGKEKRELVAEAAKAVYASKNLGQIYRRLFDQEPLEASPASLIEGSEADGIPSSSSQSGQRFGGPAESEEHRKLKQYILRHPEKVGASEKPDDARKEFMLLSGDEVDVYIACGNTVRLVEVKSIRSSAPDLIRGVYQCIKYRAVFEAQRVETTPDIQIIATLVVETDPPLHIRDLAKRHKVRIAVVSVNR